MPPLLNLIINEGGFFNEKTASMGQKVINSS